MNSAVRSTRRPAQPAVADCDEQHLQWFARRPGPWYALLWMPVLLLAPVAATIQHAAIGQFLALLLLAALHSATGLLRHRPGSVRRTEVLVGLSLLVVILYQVLWGEHQVFLYPVLALGMAVGLRRRLAMGFVGGLAVSGAIAAGLTAHSLGDALVFAVITYMAGMSAFLIDQLVGATSQLRATRELRARTAVLEERERFSRDLHDLLGHTLSLIVVKAEAVRRFAGTDARAAAEHAREIEEVGRDALGEVRQAVVGYRQATLADELDAARRALRGSGIRLDVLGASTSLPPEVDRLFAWVLREGITNILRHSRARRCTILIESLRREATLEITNHRSAAAMQGERRRDGASADGADRTNRTDSTDSADRAVRADGGSGVDAAVGEPAARRSGSGLLGLRERAEKLGGVLAADQVDDGFRLGVSVPTRQGEDS